MAQPKPPGEEPTANEWGLLRAYLAQNGYSQAQINEAIGEDNAAGRKNAEIAADLREWIKSNAIAG